MFSSKIIAILLIVGSICQAQVKVIPRPLKRITPSFIRYDTAMLRQFTGLRLFSDSSTVRLKLAGRYALLSDDMILGDTSWLNRLQRNYRFMHFSISADESINRRRWPHSTVPFDIAPGFTRREKQMILDAMNTIMAKTNICFTPVSDRSENYVHFVKHEADASGMAGNSFVGRAGFEDEQEIGLYGSSFSTGNIMHELCHALGLYHEQSREDRNDFVTINTENIIPRQLSNFDQHTFYATDMGSYDFGSIMHYGPKAFGITVDGQKQTTIVRKANPANTVFGQRDSLSLGDRSTINALYAERPLCGRVLALEPEPTPIPGELPVGGQKSIKVKARNIHTSTGVFVREGQRYSFTARSDDTWTDDGDAMNADGVESSIFVAPFLPIDVNLMSMIAYQGSEIFKVGLNLNWTATQNAFLVVGPNELESDLDDNSGRIRITIKRIE